MKEKTRVRLIIIIPALLLLLAMVSESLYFSDLEYRYKTARFNRILHQKEKRMEDCLKSLKPLTASGNLNDTVSENSLFSIARRNDITVLQYLDNKLVYWSDNDFDVPMFFDDSLYARPIIFLQNGWFLPMTIRSGNEALTGLLRVRTDYGFENEIIRSGFSKDFRMPGNVRFSTGDEGSRYHISNSRDSYLFSLHFPEIKSNSAFIAMPLLFWILLFIMLVFAGNEMIRKMSPGKNSITGFLLCLTLFSALYAFILLTEKPATLFRTELFSSYLFSYNGFIPSLGHLLVLSVLVADITLMINRFIRPESVITGAQAKGLAVVGFFLVSAAFFTGFAHTLFSHLVADSNISFEAYKVLSLDFNSVAGFSSVIIMFLVPLLLSLIAFRIGEKTSRGGTGVAVIVSVAVIIALLHRDRDSLMAATVLFLIMLVIIRISVRRKNLLFSTPLIFSLLFGLYSLYVITTCSEKKITEKMKIQALSFSTDHDPEAEHLLLDMWPAMTGDSVLKGMMESEYFQRDYNIISEYLKTRYFNGYWGNYNYSIYLCRSDDPLKIGQTGELIDNCFEFFNDRIGKYGRRLANTGFWFFDNQGGRSYYLGELQFRHDNSITHGLFIELYSDVNLFLPGYSELLLDRRFRGHSDIKDYSFAKYINGELVLKSGDFAYSKGDDEYIGRDADYRIFRSGGFRHILYRNGNATVMLSRPELNGGNLLITFAYLFAFTFILGNLVSLLIRRPALKKLINLNFRQKLQMTFIAILLFSFILIGIIITHLTVREYRSNHYDNITEKLNSIYLELDSKLAGEQSLSSDWMNSAGGSLNQLLINLSNIFNTDINLYDLNCILMATSRAEIFSRDLTGIRMNNVAMNHLKYLRKTFFSQTETIGSLKYVSVYVPFYNIDNEVIAYLNLPYFRMQSVLARDISNLIVAVINFTLLLVLITTALAVFISGRLTSPLSMLSKGLASVELGKKSEHLMYRGSDEIGELVRQYNRMVDELDQSARKLADSEREYAWREMAKQIAHEIKNPLTPMKLNVQQLLKSWKDGVQGFGERLEGFARNQIEYIDNLSSIASAFSAFAKMPGNKPVETDLLEQ
ncbi:MAG: HAMP domain-containing protein, partial [Bacteroidales bacterium]|nr:HAMP domain-containing protein [Bacteroidales bacterium]